MRIVTRPDFDGVVCATLLHEAENIDEPILWIQPHEVQKGHAEIRERDILANLPFDPRCTLWFDHHITNRIDRPFQGAFKIAPSAAGVIFEHYRDRFTKDFGGLVAAADKIDAADLSMDEVSNPEQHPYVILSMTIWDRDTTEAPYWNKLVDLFRRMEIGEILRDEDVDLHCRMAVEWNREYKTLLKQHTVLQEHVSITDFRTLSSEPEGNRFLVYAMFPEAGVSVKIRYADASREKVRVSVGHSIFNRSCRVNVGLMLTEFEGGGHRAAGGCSFSAQKAGDYIPRIVEILLKNEPNDG